MIILQCLIRLIRFGNDAAKNTEIGILGYAECREIDTLFGKNFRHFRKATGLVFQKIESCFATISLLFYDLQFTIVDYALRFTYAALDAARLYQADIHAQAQYALQACGKLFLQSQHLVDSSE
mgnify:CR=1 FL=1